MRTLILTKNLVTVNSENEIIKNGAVEIENGIITNIFGPDEMNIDSYSGKILDFSDLTLIPGFVQTHVHLCQTLFRGLAEDMELLDWLREKIFPLESAHNGDSLRISAQLGINELQKGGTTTLLDMGTLCHQEAIFEVLKETKMRAIAGGVLEAIMLAYNVEPSPGVRES